MYWLTKISMLHCGQLATMIVARVLLEILQLLPLSPHVICCWTCILPFLTDSPRELAYVHRADVKNCR